MFQKFRTKPTPSAGHVDAPRPFTPKRPRRIIVPHSAVDSVASAPDRLVSAVVSHVNFLTSQAKFGRDEILDEAIWTFNCDYYLSQVTHHGHAAFLSNNRETLAITLADIGKALKAAGSGPHRDIYERLQTWIALHPEEAWTQVPHSPAAALGLTELDRDLLALETSVSLHGVLAAWLLTLPHLRIVPDQDLDRLRIEIAAHTPDFERRRVASDVMCLTHQLTDPMHLGLGLASAGVAPPAPLLGLDEPALRTLPDGRHELCFVLTTTTGKCFGLRTEDGFELFECGSRHATARVIGIDESGTRKAIGPERTGDQIAIVPHARVDLARRICDQLRADIALYLLLKAAGLPVPAAQVSVDRVKVDREEPDHASLHVVCRDSDAILAAHVGRDGATMLSTHTGQALSTVSREQIDSFAKTLTLC